MAVMLGAEASEIHEIETKLLRAQRLELVGEISAGLVHDLNNVLLPITLAAEMYAPDKPEEELRRLKGIMTKGCLRAASIVRQFLSFTRGQQDAVVSLNVEPLLREIADMARETFPKRVKVEEKFAANLWPIKGNPTQLHQILMNLCVNARDAMPSGGTLTLTAENVVLGEQSNPDASAGHQGQFLKVCVIDTGTGISPENLQKLWQPFFTTKPVGRGTGLGLPTVRRLLEDEHHGFLKLSTSLGKGTRFDLYFPAENLI